MTNDEPQNMKILLTNDDGIHAGGLNALARELMKHCELYVIAPKTEQSGISQAITFLRPLFPVGLPQKGRPDDFEFPGYMVDGTPADCVKLAMFELCPWKPDLVISGINGGLNAGINVGFSGTVGAALTAAQYGLRSMAISLEYSTSPDFKSAAEMAWPLIQRFGKVDLPNGLVNINIPTAALTGDPEVVIVPTETNLLGTDFDQGVDPKGRPYYWSSIKPGPKPSDFETDCSALKAGKVTITPITFDMNHPDGLEKLTQANQKTTTEKQATTGQVGEKQEQA